MNSSGIKRGLAATAISALAVTGLPALATSASAVPLNNTVPAGEVELAAPQSATSSIKNDGQNTTIRLQAVGGANVSQVRFSYTIGGGSANTIATVSRNDDGSFSHEWNAAGLNGAAVTITATALNASGVAGDTDTGATTISSVADSVNINDGSALGYFRQTYTNPAAQDDTTVSITGTSSNPASAPDLEYWVQDADGVTAGNQPGYVPGGSATSTTPTGGTTGTWAGTMDIAGYDFTGNPDQLLVRAVDTSDDAEAFTLYQQTIGSVTAVPDSTSVQAGDSATVTVTVKDQAGLPIVGAEVRRSDSTEPQYTDAKGQVEYAQTAGAEYYYANATDSDPYEAELGDKRSETVTVSQYDPQETELKVTSRDGAAFDEDEFDYTATAPGANNGAEESDIVGQILDQNGNAVEEGGRTVTYRWVVTPFATPAPGTPASDFTETGTVLTDDEGKFSVDAPSIAGDDDGTWELYVTLEENVFGEGDIAESKELTVKAGDSELAFDENDPEQAQAGTSEDVSGSLTLADGTGLPGRDVLVSYDDDGDAEAEDAYIVQSDPAVTNDTDRVVKTDANGKFSVTIKDPSATPTQPTEDGEVNAETVDQTETDSGADVDNPNEFAGPQMVQFIKTTTPGAIDLEDLDNEGPGAIRPGELEEYRVTVTDGGDPATDLSNQTVTLTTDHGYFTDGTPAPAPANGADAGTYKDLGQETTVKTDEDGEATIFLAMKRDEGFDDDGMVTSNVTATAGAFSDSANQQWTSADPLNGGEVRLVFSPADEQDSENLPGAQVGQEVAFDVYTTDQFMNLVGGEEVTLADNQSDADIEGENGDVSTDPGYQVLSDFDDDGDFVATSEEEQDQTITGTWVTETYTYVGTGGGTTMANETLTDSETVEWYEVDFANATFTLTSNPEGTVPVNTAVTETVKVVDENGNPVKGLDVTFIRTGPGNQAGDRVDRTTNSNGEAFYTFVGTEKGTAQINVVVSDGEQIETLTDSVQFEQKKINAALTLKGKHNGARADRLFANAINKTEGGTVKLYRQKKNGVWKQVAKGVMNAKGNKRFVVRDPNGRKKTNYKAVVEPTNETRRGTGKNRVR